MKELCRQAFQRKRERERETKLGCLSKARVDKGSYHSKVLGDVLEAYWVLLCSTFLLVRNSRVFALYDLLKSDLNLPWAICRNVLEDFCCINFGGFCIGFSWRIFLGTFSHKNEEKKSGEKIHEKIRRLKNKNPRKIRSAESRP